jgi:transposase
MEFRELSYGEWELIKPLLPPRARTGRPRVDDRVVLNGIIRAFDRLPMDGYAIRHRHYSTASISTINGL